MNRRDLQIAAIAESTSNLDPKRLAQFSAQVRDAYSSSTVVDRIAEVHEYEDRSISDFRIVGNQELRSVQQFNTGNFIWGPYCDDFGRSVSHGETAYVFEVLRSEVPESDLAPSSGFGGLHQAVDHLAARGGRPDILLAPVSYMVGFQRDASISVEWDELGRAFFRSVHGHLEIFWSSRARPIDRFIVGDRRAGVWHVKLDPRGGGRLTVAIGEQATPVHGVIWLAETVVKYEVIDANRFVSYRPDVEPDDLFDDVR